MTQDLKLGTRLDSRIARELDAQGRIFRKRSVIEAALLAFLNMPKDDRLTAIARLNAWKAEPTSTIQEDKDDENNGTPNQPTAGSRRTASVQ